MNANAIIQCVVVALFNARAFIQGSSVVNNQHISHLVWSDYYSTILSYRCMIMLAMKYV